MLANNAVNADPLLANNPPVNAHPLLANNPVNTDPLFPGGRNVACGVRRVAGVMGEAF